MGNQRVTKTKADGTFVSSTGIDEPMEARIREKLTNFRAPKKSAEETEPGAVATPVPAENTTTPRGQIPEWMKKRK